MLGVHALNSQRKVESHRQYDELYLSWLSYHFLDPWNTPTICFGKASKFELEPFND